MRKAIVAGLLAWANLLGAQDTIGLGEAVVTDNRISLPVSQTNRNITVITREQIEMLPAQNLNDVLATVAGVDLRQRGPWGMQADVSIRGGTFDQALILVNGVKMNDPQTGHHNLNLGIDPASIKQIEILKGPAAARYGLNALSGVINIVIAPDNENRISGGAYGASDFGNYDANDMYAGHGEKLGLNWKIGKSSHLTNAGFDGSEGFRPNTDFQRLRFMHLSQFRSSAGDFSLMLMGLGNDFGASGFYAFPVDSGSWESVRTGVASVSHRKQWGKWLLTSRAYWRKNSDHYVLFRENPSYYENLHETDTWGGEAHTSYSYGTGTAGLGVEFRQEMIESSNLGSDVRSNLGVFAENRLWALKSKMSLGTSLYVNFSSEFGTQLLPSLDLSYQLSKDFTAFANYGRGFRLPTYTDLYYTGPTNIGNPMLQPEQSYGVEGGAKWMKGPFSATASYFYQEMYDMIDWTRSSDTLPWQPLNYEQVAINGVDVQAQWTNRHETEGFQLYSFSLGYTGMQMALNSEGTVESRYQRSHLRHQLTSALSLRLASSLSLTVSARYADRFGYKSYWLVDSRLGWKKPRYEVYADVANLLNTRYFEITNAPMPGRWFRVGFDFSFALDRP